MYLIVDRARRDEIENTNSALRADIGEFCSHVHDVYQCLLSYSKFGAETSEFSDRFAGGAAMG